MHNLKKTFTILMMSLFGLMIALIILAMTLASSADAAESEIPMPVSINALMVTLIDHSAHYIWDYGSLEERMEGQEWQAVEYYSIQLAAAGPLITLGGTGPLDNEWVKSDDWTAWSIAMTEAAKLSLEAARIQDHQLLMEAGNQLVDSCEGCHDAFKPDTPTEGIIHDPMYDHLYHLFERQHSATVQP